MKKIRGGEKAPPISVELPAGCTTAADCDWICKNMVKGVDANDEGIDMNKQAVVATDAGLVADPEATVAATTTRMLSTVTLTTAY